MARRRSRAQGDSPDRLAAAKALHAAAMARLRARMSGRPLPPLPEATPPPEPPRTSPEQAYRNTTRLLGEGNEP